MATTFSYSRRAFSSVPERRVGARGLHGLASVPVGRVPSHGVGPAAVSRRGMERPISIYSFGGLLLLHMVLARVEKGHALLVMLHGLAALGAALLYGTNPRHPKRTIQAVAYICGAEVLWHMCARSDWESV